MNSIDEVLPNLFIGSYDDACDSVTLDHFGITHILTVASDLPAKYTEKYTYLIIQALDLDTQDLFPSFSQSFEFIENSLSNNGKVLVHCLYGISRSSTIVISYIMKKLNIHYEQAFTLLKEKHPRADPNDGFVRQLKKLDSIMFGTSLPYLCRCCRCELFNVDDLVEHSSKDSKKFKKGKSGDGECKSLFVGKMDWMGECSENSGRIDCAYCLSKLGNYNWAGRQCSCGKFVTPAFQISRSAVDGQIPHEGYIAHPKKWE